MDALSSQLEELTLSTAPYELAYLIGKNGKDASYFLPYSNEFFVTRCLSNLDNFEIGNLYKRTMISSCVSFSKLDKNTKKVCTRRRSFEFTEDQYDQWILRPLLLGCRVRDFEQNCATVISRSPLILTMPNRREYIKRARFYSENGECIDVVVNDRLNDQKTMKLFCTPVGTLPSTVGKNDRLEFQTDDARVSIVTTALESVYNDHRSIDDFRLLDLIYGEAEVVVHPRVSRSLIKIRKDDPTLRKYVDIILNAEQSEAVRHYQSDDCPAFAVESPPGSGKTLTAAAMAVSYDGPGLQLLLSTANVPVFNMAIALDDLDYADKRIIHLVSAEREAREKDHERSPFSILEQDEEALESFKEYQEDLSSANGREARWIREQMRRTHARALSSIEEQDIILGTVDMRPFA